MYQISLTYSIHISLYSMPLFIYSLPVLYSTVKPRLSSHLSYGHLNLPGIFSIRVSIFITDLLLALYLIFKFR